MGSFMHKSKLSLKRVEAQARLRSLGFGLLASGFLLSCNAASKGPDIPEPIDDLGSGAAPGENGEALPQSGTGNEAADVYGDLPLTFRQGLKSCENLDRYYDISLGACTETALSSLTCNLELLLGEQSPLSPTVKTKLQDYVNSNLSGYKLFACTENADDYELHFYQVVPDRVKAYNVKLLKNS